MSKFKTLRLILGDQLNENHSWFADPTAQIDTLYTMMEIRTETDYVRHHIQKVVGFFLAMRHFADSVKARGFSMRYFQLDDENNFQSFEKNIVQLLDNHQITHLEIQEPDEWRLDQMFKKMAMDLSKSHNISVHFCSSEHFLTDREAVARQFEGKKTFVMEPFYRKIRAKYQILMQPDGKNPEGNRWNFDAENRKKLPKTVNAPPIRPFVRNVETLVEMLEKQGVETIGRIDAKHFDWAVTREESLFWLDEFVRFRLHSFGTYEDAMSVRTATVFHSKLSFAMNLKILHPLDVVRQSVKYYEKNKEIISLSQIEGFVRQIVGWREYMRGIYWAKMPEFATLNFFEHRAPLPAWFWTGEVKMNCLHDAVNRSLDNAWAHHIQRLMVTGAFTLMLGVDPDAVDAWYLGIYADALDWVELPNTRGMSQYADGGIVGTKPYLGSANYIQKMSDYCETCAYNPKIRFDTGGGDKACPLNVLYWDFYIRNDTKLRKNPRIGMMYPQIDKMTVEEKQKIQAKANEYRQNVERL